MSIKSQLKQLNLKQIVLNPQKYRHFELDKEGVVKLAQDIEEKGMLVPVLVWHKNEKYILIAGHHRYEAAKKLKWKSIPAQTMHFEKESQALEASIETNAQDQYTFTKRSWYERFIIAEKVLREIYEQKACKRKKGAKKVNKKIRVDEQLARGVGLAWSHVKYGQMRKIQKILESHKIFIEKTVEDCLKSQNTPKIQLWLEILQLYKEGKIKARAWEKFVATCNKILSSEIACEMPDEALRSLRRSTLRKDKGEKINSPDYSGTLFISWHDKEGRKVWEEIKDLCQKANWKLEADSKPKKGPGGYSQKIVFTINK